MLVECDDLADALGLMHGLADHDQINEIIPGARTLLIKLASPITNQLASTLLTLSGVADNQLTIEPLTIEVSYDGQDLAEVAELTGLTTQQVIEAHTGQLWTVAFTGFAPGFAYLQGETEALQVPRRATPRTRVPAGAVALADQWSGIYPRIGPGGWQLIGTTTAALWDLDQHPPALLQPGQRVRFVQANP